MAINSLNSSSRGLSGLASGMDTQQMVDAMLAGTQNKIDATNQKKTQLTYKQNMFRELNTKLLNFQNSFFSYTSNTNMMSPTFFNSMTATTASKAFSAIASSSASVGKSVVNSITSLAMTERAKSKEAVTGKLEGTFDVEKMKELVKSLDQKVTFKVEGSADITVSIAELVGKNDTPNGTLEIEKLLKQKLDTVADVSYENGKLMLSAENGKKITVSGDEKALAIFGLKGERVTDADGKMSMSINPTVALPSLNVTVNGVRKSVIINPFSPDASGNWTTDQFAQRMNNVLQKAFGSKISVAENTSGKIEFSMMREKADGTLEKDPTSQITIAADATNGGSELMKAFGVASGKSNKINTGMTLAEANFASPILGGVHKFTINGVDFSVDSSRSIYSVLDEINSSNAGVTISYQSTEDKFVIESKVSGKLSKDAFEMSQSEGNFLTALFGVDQAGTFSTKALTGEGVLKGTDLADPTKSDYPEKSVVMLSVDGKVATLEVAFKDGDTHNAETFVTRLNEAIYNHKDVDNPDVYDLRNKVAFTYNYDKKEDKANVSMSANTGNEVRIANDGLKDLGLLTNQSIYRGQAKAGTSMDSLGLKDMTVEIGGQIVKATYTEDGIEKVRTVQQFADALNEATQAAVKAAYKVAGKSEVDATNLSKNAGAELDKNTGRYRIFGIDIPMGMVVKGDNSKLMGAENISIGGSGAMGADNLETVQTGENAVATINGVTIERSSNNFTIDGITYELRNTTTTAETVEVTRDTDKIYEGVTKFIEEYNKLVDSINEQLDADATYRDYPPLTEAQKQSMSDREVELWEEKSKGGLLRNNSTVETVMNSLRSTLYTRPDGGMALYELGIQPNSYYGEKDHLTVDDPAKLKQMISENPSAVQALFTDTEKGLSQLLNNAITKAASTNSGSPGMLVREAGATGRVDTSSSIYRQIRDLNDRLSNLNNTYTKQHDRYWKQFNSMEQLISQMNQQSSWLTQQFS